MRQETGWSEATVCPYRARTEAFLGWLGPETHTVADIALADVDRYLGAKGAPGGCCRITLRNHVSALRAFFRFAERRGRRASGLSAAITAPRVYRDAGLPVGPTADDVRRLLETTEGDSPADLRDRAVLLLLSSYGLRAGEVRGLRLDDIDWEAETFRVRRSKAGSTAVFPLSRRLGDALLRYLREARPPCGDREIGARDLEWHRAAVAQARAVAGGSILAFCVSIAAVTVRPTRTRATAAGPRAHVGWAQARPGGTLPAVRAAGVGADGLATAPGLGGSVALVREMTTIARACLMPIPKENDQRSNLKTIGRSGRARKERGAWRRRRGSAIFFLERRL